MRPSASWGPVRAAHASFHAALSMALSLLVVAGPGLPAWAAPVQGMYEIPFSGNESIWPLPSLQDCEAQVIDGINVDICLGMSFNRSGKGAVDGSGTFDFAANGIGVAIQGNLAGALTGTIAGTDRRGYKQSVSLKFKGTVSVSGAGNDMPATMTGKLKTSITQAGVIETKGAVKVKVKGGATTKAKVVTGLEQLEEGSGDWVLKLIIQASGDQTKLSGSAELVLPAGSQFIPLDGVYKPRSDKAQLSAKGKKDTKGIQVDLKNLRSSDPGIFDRGTVTYSVEGFSGGQSLKK